jgi:hypothetical protein
LLHDLGGERLVRIDNAGTAEETWHLDKQPSSAIPTPETFYPSAKDAEEAKKIFWKWFAAGECTYIGLLLASFIDELIKFRPVVCRLNGRPIQVLMATIKTGFARSSINPRVKRGGKQHGNLCECAFECFE